ncbi:MAG: hypothetical protein ABS75_31810 [Pelagibacterium sp. SCN 63-23]|nr:MAG: hypothetical protein ABS75_31810 [Pelagibacterium sp. SCN 63-23]
MHVVVIGAGVIGITSAWYLAQSGCRVTVLERNAAPALGTSYANVGQISPGLSAPWSSPGMVAKAIAGLFKPHSPFVISRFPDLEMSRWLMQFLANCNDAAYLRNKQRMVELAEYSRDRLRVLRGEIALDYEARMLGTLVFFRDEDQRKQYEADLAVLDRLGVPYRRLSAAQIAEREPNLDIARNNGIGGVLLPDDETGDCHRFTQDLASHATGVDFHYGVTMERLVVRNGAVRGVIVDGRELTADAVVLAAGVDAVTLLRPLNVSVPVYPVKGYSLTIKAASDEVGPLSTISDETYKVGVTNLGQSIRVGGTAELAGYDLTRPERRYDSLRLVARQLFPAIPNERIDQAECWSGLRPMTPDGMPRIGPLGPDGLYVNVGHGTLGWTMACGASARLAAMVSGREAGTGIDETIGLQGRTGA